MKSVWIVGESLPLTRNGTARLAKPNSGLPDTLVPMDPRHGVFPNLVMKPLFAALLMARRNGDGGVASLLSEFEALVCDESDRRFNVFQPRITFNEENPDDLFVIDEASVSQRINALNGANHLWLTFGHQTNFGLLKWLLEGDPSRSQSRRQICRFSDKFVKRLREVLPEFCRSAPTSKSGKVGLLHRLCMATEETGLASKAVLRNILAPLRTEGRFEPEQIAFVLRSTVPLLHNEAYQDARNPIGNAQSHFVQNATTSADNSALYWRVMGNAILRQLLGGEPTPPSQLHDRVPPLRGDRSRNAQVEHFAP